MGYLEDPALRLAIILFGSGLILSALVIDAGLVARVALVILGATPSLPIIFHRK